VPKSASAGTNRSTVRLTPNSRLAIRPSASRPKFPSTSLLIVPKPSAPRWVMHWTGTPARSSRPNATRSKN